ncbi:MAG: prepilin-type N-terminal cleavage/methylation domain-containing protein [Deltaproteobacteria bacterium]|nr:prepilin-type N-terminal cleavage/methylation domain-containing protein [Deltaproteobacteria bacterium]
MRALRDRRGGFTLLEIMIAIAILGIVMSLIYGSFARTFEVRDFVSRVQERYHSVRVAMERMARELSMAFIYDCRELDTPTGERHFWTTFKVVPRGKMDEITFCSFAHLRLFRDVDESDQSEISYYSQEDPEDASKNNLIRREKTRIDGRPGEGGEEMVLCPDIESLNFELWDEVDQDWVEEWDCSQMERQNQLPRMVRITMTVVDEHGEEIPFTTTTRIFTNKPLANWLKPSQ